MFHLASSSQKDSYSSLAAIGGNLPSIQHFQTQLVTIGKPFPQAEMGREEKLQPLISSISSPPYGLLTIKQSSTRISYQFTGSNIISSTVFWGFLATYILLSFKDFLNSYYLKPYSV